MKIKFWLALDKNIGLFTWIPEWFYDNISLDSSHNEKCIRWKLQRKLEYILHIKYIVSKSHVIYEIITKISLPWLIPEKYLVRIRNNNFLTIKFYIMSCHFLLGPNIFLSTLFLNILAQLPVFSVKDEVTTQQYLLFLLGERWLCLLFGDSLTRIAFALVSTTL